MDAAIIWDEAYAEHDTGDHPEGADRVSTMVAHLEGTDLWPRLRVFTGPEPAGEDDILRVHTRTHLGIIKRAARGNGTWIDPDTHVSPRSYEVALLSAGGALLATDLWQQGLVPFALIRPPGHHATPDRAMGFCLFNNIAIAAARLLERGYERVAILDWDVHHGNGTQAAFYAEPRVLFGSAHEWPHYPGSGFFTECGEGDGEGFTVNVPLPAGADDGDYASAFDAVFDPIVRQFAPQALLVSAGQDIHRADPLGDMRVDEAGLRPDGAPLRAPRAGAVRRQAGVRARGWLRARGEPRAPSRPCSGPCSTRARPRCPPAPRARRRRPRPSRGRARCSPPTGASRPPSP